MLLGSIPRILRGLSGPAINHSRRSAAYGWRSSRITRSFFGGGKGGNKKDYYSKNSDLPSQRSSVFRKVLRSLKSRRPLQSWHKNFIQTRIPHLMPSRSFKISQSRPNLSA